VFRNELGLTPLHERPAPLPDIIAAQFEVIVEERVPVFSVGLGNPGADRVTRCHERGVRVMAMAATLDDAQALEAVGVDVLVVQGSEAGGHRSTWVKRESPQAASVGTMALVPEVVDAVSAPVVAAGGIADGRGVVAALALGAQGVLLGTRFVATKESMAPPFFKQAILNGSGASTRVTDVFTGLYARGIRNRFLTEYERSGAPVLPPLLQTNAAQDIYMAAAMKGDEEHFPMLAGQSMGIIDDLPGAADVVRALVEEAERVRARLCPATR
jgi:nitronate monooxygenase